MLPQSIKTTKECHFNCNVAKVRLNVVTMNHKMAVKWIILDEKFIKNSKSMNNIFKHIHY